MKGFILIAIMLCLFSCGKDNPKPADPTPDSTIHLAGIAGDGGYWENSTFHSLGDVWGINSMSIDGTNVLIGGSDTIGKPKLWLNGEGTTFDGGPGGVTLVAIHGNNTYGIWATTSGWVTSTNGTITPMSPDGWPTAMAVVGEDVYVAGNSQGNDYPWGTAFYPLDTHALFWKNGDVIFSDSVHTYANAIFIHQNDIYLGGNVNHYPSLDRIACYWKNGQRFNLTSDDQDAEVTSLFVTDTHFYAAGVINNQAVYWKDGDAVMLSNGLTNSIANSISVLGTDVYVAGQEDKHPAVWKNGVKKDIPNQDKQGEIKVIVTLSN